MSSWTDPRKGGAAQGATAYPSLSALLASTAQGVPLTVSGTTANLVRGDDGKLSGTLGNVSQATLNALTAGELAQLAVGSWRDCGGAVVSWNGVTWVPPRMPVSRNGRTVHIMGDSTTTAENGLQWAELLCLLSRGRFIRGINAATSGAKIQDLSMSQLTQKILGVPCDEIWIQIGTNNVGETPSVATDRLVLLLSDVRKIYPTALVRIFSILPASNNPVGTKWVYAYNSALQAFAKRNGCEYHAGWDGITDAGGALSAEYLAGDVSGLHSGVRGNLVGATARCIDIFGSIPSSIITPPIGEGVIAWNASLMIDDSDANGVADTWTSYSVPNGTTSVASLADASAPYFGRWQTRTLSALPVSVHNTKVAIPALPGKDYEFAIAMSLDYQSNASMRAHIVFSSSPSSNVEIGRYTIGKWNGAAHAAMTVDGYLRCLIPREIIPSGTRSFTISLTSDSTDGITGVVRLGMMTLRELVGWR